MSQAAKLVEVGTVGFKSVLEELHGMPPGSLGMERHLHRAIGPIEQYEIDQILDLVIDDHMLRESFERFLRGDTEAAELAGEIQFLFVITDERIKNNLTCDMDARKLPGDQF